MADDGYKATSIDKTWKGEGKASVYESRLNKAPARGTAMKAKKSKSDYD